MRFCHAEIHGQHAAKQILWECVELGFVGILAIMLIYLILGQGSGVFVLSVADNVTKFAKRGTDTEPDRPGTGSRRDLPDHEPHEPRALSLQTANGRNDSARVARGVALA